MPEQLRNVHSSLTLELASRIVDEAISTGRREKLLPLAVAVVHRRNRDVEALTTRAGTGNG